jgi:hypothetical protein
MIVLKKFFQSSAESPRDFRPLPKPARGGAFQTKRLRRANFAFPAFKIINTRLKLSLNIEFSQRSRFEPPGVFRPRAFNPRETFEKAPLSN